MKILILIYSLDAGGAEKVTSLLSNYLSQRGFSITILTISATKSFFDFDQNIQIESLNLSRESNGLFSAVRNNLLRIIEIRKVLKKLQPDIALSMMTSANILLGLSSINLKNLSLIGSERSNPAQENISKIRFFLRKYVYRNFTYIVAQTPFAYDWLSKNTFSRKIELIENPVEWPINSLGEQNFIKPILNDKKILLAVGRVSEEKGFFELLKIFDQLVYQYEIENWQLVILGDGPLMDDLIAYKHNLSSSDKIMLPGRVSNMNDWYGIADIFVLTSKFEGYPNALIEAMAYGVPCVSYDCESGPGQIIDHGINGILVENQNAVKMKESLWFLMQKDEERKRLAEEARLIRGKLSLPTIGQKWINLFNRTMSK